MTLRLLLLLLLLAAPAGRLSAQPSAGDPVSGATAAGATTDSSLVGTWILVAADELHPDGTRVPAYGPNPEGLLIFDRPGHYSVFISRVARAPFKSGDKARGTADEYRAASLDVSTHYGRYSADFATHTLTFDIAHASFPNLDGAEQKRPFELVGDQLTWRVPPHADGAIPISVWRRER